MSAITIDSPYFFSTRYVFADGVEELSFSPPTYELTGNEELHILRAGESLEDLAELYFKNQSSNPAKYAYVLAIVNEIDNPLLFLLRENIYTNTELIIPDLISFFAQNA